MNNSRVDQASVRPLDLHIPLDAGTATLRIPIPMSLDDLEVLTKALDFNLRLFKSNLTKAPAAPGALLQTQEADHA